MIKLLLAVVIIGLLASFLWRQQGLDEDSESAVMRNEQMEKAADLEVQMQQDLEVRMQEVNRKSD